MVSDEEALTLAKMRPALLPVLGRVRGRGCVVIPEHCTWVDMSVIHMFVCSVGDDGAAGVIGGSHHVHIVPEADAS